MSTTELGYQYYSEARMMYYKLLAGDEYGFVRDLNRFKADHPHAVPFLIASIMHMINAAALELHLLEILENMATRKLRKELNMNADTEVKVIKNRDSFSVLVGGKILCDSSSSGCQRFRTYLQAEVAGNQYLRGYDKGCFLSSDVDNYVTG